MANCQSNNERSLLFVSKIEICRYCQPIQYGDYNATRKGNIIIKKKSSKSDNSSTLENGNSDHIINLENVHNITVSASASSENLTAEKPLQL